TAGLAAIDNLEQPYLKDGRITHENAEKVAAKVKADHPVFKSFTVKDGGKRWDYHWEASPGNDTAGVEKAEEDGILVISVLEERPPGRSRVGGLSITPTTSASAHEEQVGAALEEKTELTAQEGPLPERIRRRTLLREPKVGEAPGLRKYPDYLLLSKTRIEVFEATLDADFELGRPTEESGISHKRLQL